MISKRDRLDHAFLSGVAWLGTLRWASQMSSWVITIWVARLLGPSAYGIAGMAMVVIGLAAVLVDFGLGAAVIALPEQQRRAQQQLHGAAIMLGVLGMGAVAAAGPAVGRFYGDSRVTSVLVWLSLTFVVDGLRTVPAAILTKQLKYRAVAISELARTLVANITTLAWALFHPTYWALVAGALAGSVAATISILFRDPIRPRWPDLHEAEEALRYSRRLLVGRLAWYGYTSSDALIAGKLLGAPALGSYSWAMNVALLPSEKITAIVTSASLAAFAAVQDDVAQLRRYFSGLTAGLSLVMFPTCAGLALVSPELVRTLVGAKWDAAIVPLQLLAVYSIFRSVTTLLSQVLNVSGQARFTMWNGLAILAVLPPCFLVGSRLAGINGIAAAWLVTFPLVVGPILFRTLRTVEMPLLGYLVLFRPAALSTLVMAIVVWVAGLALATRLAEAPRLLALSSLGAFTYAAFLWGAFPNTWRTYAGVARRMIGSLRPSATPGRVPNEVGVPGSSELTSGLNVVGDTGKAEQPAA